MDAVKFTRSGRYIFNDTPGPHFSPPQENSFCFTKHSYYFFSVHTSHDKKQNNNNNKNCCNFHLSDGWSVVLQLVERIREHHWKLVNFALNCVVVKPMYRFSICKQEAKHFFKEGERRHVCITEWKFKQNSKFLTQRNEQLNKTNSFFCAHCVSFLSLGFTK